MHQPDISIINKAGSLSISTGNLSKVVPSCVLDWCKNSYLPFQLNVYGPDVNNISVTGGAQLTINNIDQTNLSMGAFNNSTINLGNGYIETISISALNNSNVWASSVTAKTDNITEDTTSIINAPSSPNLNANFTAGCDQQLDLNSDPVNTIINGQAVSVNSLNNNQCLTVSNPIQAPAPPRSPL